MKGPQNVPVDAFSPTREHITRDLNVIIDFKEMAATQQNDPELVQ